MQRCLFLSLFVFLAVFAFGGGLLIVAWRPATPPEIPPIQIIE